MSNIGYVRVSSVEQNSSRQLEGLTLDKIFEDKCSGSSKSRPALTQLLEYVREGDHIYVHSIDRLARNLNDLKSIVEQLNNKDIAITFVKNTLTFSSDSNNPMNNLMLNMLGAFSEFERELIRERQAEGIAKAKEKGVYIGRKPTIDKQQLADLIASGMKPKDIQQELGISKASFYRLKQQIE